MINKLKIGFLVMVLSLAVGITSVYAADVNFSTDTTVSVGGNNYTIVAGSVATAPLVIGSTTLSVVVPTGTFTLVSNNRFDLGQSAGVATCDGTTNSVVVTGPTSVVFTPIASEACSSAGVTGGGSGHHGSSSHSSGGGSSSSVSTTPAPAAAVVCPVGVMYNSATGEKCTATISGDNVCPTGAMFNPTTGQKCSTVTVILPNMEVNPSGMGYAFGTMTVKQGSTGAGCKAWQMFFNDKGHAGLVVDGNCGPKTMAFAKTWQASVGLKADGMLGAMSRAKAMMQ